MSRIALAAGSVLAVAAFLLYPKPALERGASGAPVPGSSSDRQDLGCTLNFSLSTWSFELRHSEGSGVVRCDSGATMRVRVAATGAGLSSASTHVDGGIGKFTDVPSLREILGEYSNSAVGIRHDDTQTLSKGTILLALTGTSKKVDLASGIAEFTLTRFR